MAYLVVREPGRVAFAHPLTEACAIGRGEENELVLRDKHVSRLHARLTRDGAVYAIQDMDSRHGTFVNQLRISAGKLAPGDVIQIGGVILHYQTSVGHEAVILESATADTPPGPSDASQRRLAVLYHVGRAVGGAVDPAELARSLLEGAIEALAAHTGALELEGMPRTSLGTGAADLVVGRPLLQALLGRRESVLATEGTHGSAVAAPLLVEGRAAGFIYLGRAVAPPFVSADRDFVNALAQLFAASLAQAERQSSLARVAEALRSDREEPELIGTSMVMHALGERITRLAAASDTAVLITGESGTGKDLVARLLHARSSRRDQPFVAVNCAALPDTLVESELFGHEKGAFTGAARSRRGKFALAHGGTLFLDEIGDLGVGAQAKMLRAIELGQIEPLGAEGPVRADVRVVSATHKPLAELIEAGRFRADLYYRLAVVEVAVPPLRERGADVVLLAESFLMRAARRQGRSIAGLGFTAEARAALRAYAWPGNVRQLANEVERALLLSDGPLVDLEDLRARLEPDVAPRGYDGAERGLFARVLAENGGNIRATARALGISRGRVYRKLTKYKLL